MSLIGKLLGRLNAFGRGEGDIDPFPDEPVVDGGSVGAGSSRVRRLLDQAEAEALAAYERTGLPNVRGVYRRGANDAGWSLMPELTTPAARFDYVLNGLDQGERHAGLPQIGRLARPGDPIIALAADLIEQVTAVRDRLAGGGIDPSGRHDLEVAFELTMTWMRLCEAVAEPEPVQAPDVAPRKPAPARRKASSATRRPRKTSTIERGDK
ncbi:hypothetical protein ACO2Q1_05520 [Brevundimonas sp. VNH65]|uniref:hypothetical protein n=1 Tax=Brevundimonas sp. VNH65 TaxID=3400917 RepID=UPI003BFECDBD